MLGMKLKYRYLDREQDSIPPRAWHRRLQQQQPRTFADSGTSLMTDSVFCSFVMLNPCQPWFPPTVHDSTMRITANPLALVYKTILTTFAVVMYMFALGRMKMTFFFFAYFTYWAATANCFYLLLSCWNSWISFLDESGTVTAWCIHCSWRTMWLLFEIATHSGLGSAVGMWGAVAYLGIEEMKQGKSLDASDIVWHGLIFVLTMVDGVVLNTIEFRWVHWSGVLLPLGIVYILWTVVHAFAIGANPEISSNSDALNDDAIYPVVVWKDDWKSSLLVCLVSFVGLGFLGFGFLRLVSSRVRSILRGRSQQGMYAWMGVSHRPVVDIPSLDHESVVDENEKVVYA